MKQRNLGVNGFTVAEVGLGCWQFGGDFGEMSEQTAFSIMERAVERGINFFDTADVYGGGRSETLIGRFLKQTGASLRVATKFGRGADVSPDKYSPETLRRGIDASRERLGVEQIDLLQLHCIPTEIMQQGEIFDWLRTEKEAGTMAQQSLRWILDHDAVSVVIPGASSVAQVVSNAEASELTGLDAAVHAKLAEFYRNHVADHIRGVY